MYTGLRARVKIKEKYRGDIQKLHDERSWEDTNIPNIDGWLAFGRNRFIPFGITAYMPEEFDEPFEEREDEYGKVTGGTKFDGEWWTFSCALKNYEGEIQFFIEFIMSEIIEEVDYCESFYEEGEYPLDCIKYFGDMNEQKTS